MPENIPKLSDSEINDLSNLSYTNLVIEVLARFIDSGEIPKLELAKLVKRAHETFDIPEVVGLKRLTDNLTVAELFHGTTLTFKDLALSVVGRLCDFFLGKRQENLIVVVGNQFCIITSNDLVKLSKVAIKRRKNIQ